MTGSERTRLKQAVDQAVRERLQQMPAPRCAGCGGELDNYTDGCSHCKDRASNRRRRQREKAARERDRYHGRLDV